MRKYTEAFTTAFLTLLSLSLFVSHIPVWRWFYHVWQPFPYTPFSLTTRHTVNKSLTI